MARGRKKTATPKQIEALRHSDAKRKNIPTAELQSAAQRAEELQPYEPVQYQRRYPLAEGETRPRDPDLDPQLLWKGARVRLNADQLKEATEKGYIDISDAQLVWRGKDQQDWSDLVVQAPPLYIQEKVHPKAIIDDLARQTKEKREAETDAPDLFSDFNGIDPEAKTEFYQHDQNWTNRFILGDSLQVMASLAERESLRGQVQCIYFDPPYGIKFNSNWQVSTRSRDVKDGKIEEITREPEQVRAFRDTWKDGIHSYLAYLRDRLTVMRDLLTDSGSIFVQISAENLHRVRVILDEVFGEENFASQITFQSTTSLGTSGLSSAGDYILWYYRSKQNFKYRQLLRLKSERGGFEYYSYVRSKDGAMWRGNAEDLENPDYDVFFPDNMTSQRPLGQGDLKEFEWAGQKFRPGKGTFKTEKVGLQRLAKSNRLYQTSGGVLRYVRLVDDYPVVAINNLWSDTGTGSFTETKTYVVQTNTKIIERCILMASDPGDLVLDPTCGSGTTATCDGFDVDITRYNDAMREIMQPIVEMIEVPEDATGVAINLPFTIAMSAYSMVLGGNIAAGAADPDAMCALGSEIRASDAGDEALRIWTTAD